MSDSTRVTVIGDDLLYNGRAYAPGAYIDLDGDLAESLIGDGKVVAGEQKVVSPIDIGDAIQTVKDRLDHLSPDEQADLIASLQDEREAEESDSDEPVNVEAELNKLKLPELQARAEAAGLAVPEKAKKADLVNLLATHEAEESD